MKNKLPSIINGLGGLLLAAGPWTVFPVCPVGEAVMACYYSARVVTLLGMLLVACGAVQLLRRADRFTGCLFSVGVYLAAALVPAWAVGGCGNPAMACRQTAFPFLYLVCILGGLAQLALAFWRSRRGGPKGEPLDETAFH